MREGQSLRLGPADSGEVPFTLDGEKYEVVVPPDGLLVCGWARHGAWPYLVPWGLADWCQEAFLTRLLDPVGPVDLRVCWQIAVAVAPDVYGVPWWTAGRIAASMSKHWDRYAAWAVAHGFNPSTEPAHRVTASGLAWLRSSVHEEDDARRLEAELFTPPKPARRKARNVPGFTPAEQASAFRATMANLGSG